MRIEGENMVGKGNTAEVFEYGDKKVCKLFNEGYPKEYVELEYKNAKEVFSLKLNVPEPFEVIEVEKRTGIVYEKIEGKSLLELMVENEEDCDRILDEFVKLHSELLSQHTQSVLSYKDFLVAMVKNKEAENQLLINKILSLPDGDCLIHGDFHPDNVMVKPDSTLVIIDFMNVCHGPALYDIARTFFLLKGVNRCIADEYLIKTGVSEGDIMQYIEVIELCRKYES